MALTPRDLQKKKSNIEADHPTIKFTESNDWIDDFDGCPFDVTPNTDPALFQHLSELAGSSSSSTPANSLRLWREYSDSYHLLSLDFSWTAYKGLDISCLMPLYQGVSVDLLGGRRGDSNTDPAEHEDSAHVLLHNNFSSGKNSSGMYWSQRYTLFTLFDLGIKMDIEGWFSATPECIAKRHARRCLEDVGGERECLVFDAFSGVGGNCIRFAEIENTRVIAIDLDDKKIEYARINARIYGVEDKIRFCKQDFYKLAAKYKEQEEEAVEEEAVEETLEKPDVIFLSPPWGEPAYLDQGTFDITNETPFNGKKLFDAAKHIAPKVAMFLPRNVNIDQLVEIALSVYPPWKLEVEMNKINGVQKAITAYFTKIG